MRLLVVVAIVACLAGCGTCGSEAAGTGATEAASDDPTLVRDDETMDAAIAGAMGRASHSGRRVLLVFVGDRGNVDTRMVVRLLGEQPAAGSVERGYVRVFANVGDDLGRHVRLRRVHDVTALVTLVVVDPLSGRRVARRVFAPATGDGTVTSQTLAAWLDDPHGR